MSTAALTASATGAGTASISNPMQPASWMARASSTIFRASSAVLPCSLNPPYWCMKCGHMPTWLITGTPASAMALRMGNLSRPPCIFTQSTSPSFMNLSALPTATSGLA